MAGTGMGLSQMNALLTSQSVMKNVTNMGSNLTRMKGEKGVLESQIKSDKDRGVDTKAKEERLEAADSGIESITGALSETASTIGEKIAEDTKKIRAEEAKEEKAVEKKEEAERLEAMRNKSSETVDTAVQPDGSLADPVDTVEISDAARAAAAAASASASVPLDPGRASVPLDPGRGTSEAVDGDSAPTV